MIMILTNGLAQTNPSAGGKLEDSNYYIKFFKIFLKKYLTYFQIYDIIYVSRGTDDHSQEILGGLARKTRVSGAEDWLTRRGQEILHSPQNVVEYKRRKTRTVLKTRKGKSMKNSTMNTIYAALSTVDFADKEAIMTELYNEIHRGDAAKEAKVAEYAGAREVVLEGLRVAGKPITLAELWDEVKDSLPNFTKNQVSYGLRHYWADDVAVTVGKVNMYSLREGA